MGFVADGSAATLAMLCIGFDSLIVHSRANARIMPRRCCWLHGWLLISSDGVRFPGEVLTLLKREESYGWISDNGAYNSGSIVCW